MSVYVAVLCVLVGLQWEGDVCDGVVVAGHGELGDKAAEGASKQVASACADEELKEASTHTSEVCDGEEWCQPPTSCPLPLSAREVMAPST